VVPVSYHDFFGGCATVAGALIGLLFVAISVSPEKLAGDRANADHQVKAGAAFSALINTLVIALVALLPGTGLGAASIALASTGLASTIGLIILLWREHKERIRLGQVFVLVALIVLYGLQLANGPQLDGSTGDVNAVDNQGVLAIAFFLFAIARAWQLVGARDTSLLSTVAAMAQRQVSQDTHRTEGDQAPKADPPSSQDDAG
jgi:hypothetical protein